VDPTLPQRPDHLRRTRLRTARRHRQLLFRFVAAAYERPAPGIGSHWPFESWGRFLPEHTTTVSMLDRLLHHCHVVVTDGDSYRMKQARQRTGGRRTTS
jgi:DNA replication protein DnaC